MSFLEAHLEEVATRTLEHLALSFGSTLVAVVLGVPLGIVAARSARLERPLLSIVDVIQTIPSLALFGLLLPLPLVGGIGATPAVVALVLYALLPIARTTVTGLRGIDPAIREAAIGVGTTSRQRLFLVELPLALPTMLAGVRIAAVTSVGTATIAAAIGAGGLGTFVFRGVAVVDDRLILLGAVPAAALAIVIDLALRFVERRLGPRSAIG